MIPLLPQLPGLVEVSFLSFSSSDPYISLVCTLRLSVSLRTNRLPHFILALFYKLFMQACPTPPAVILLILIFLLNKFTLDFLFVFSFFFFDCTFVIYLRKRFLCFGGFIPFFFLSISHFLLYEFQKLKLEDWL